MKKLLIVLLIVGAILLAGCTQQGDNLLGEANSVNSKCGWNFSSVVDGTDRVVASIYCSRGIPAGLGGTCSEGYMESIMPDLSSKGALLTCRSYPPNDRVHAQIAVQCCI